MSFYSSYVGADVLEVLHDQIVDLHLLVTQHELQLKRNFRFTRCLFRKWWLYDCFESCYELLHDHTMDYQNHNNPKMNSRRLLDMLH